MQNKSSLFLLLSGFGLLPDCILYSQMRCWFYLNILFYAKTKTSLTTLRFPRMGVFFISAFGGSFIMKTVLFGFAAFWGKYRCLYMKLIMTLSLCVKCLFIARRTNSIGTKLSIQLGIQALRTNSFGTNCQFNWASSPPYQFNWVLWREA